MRLVVIGGVAAGTKAASRARRVNPDLDITLYQEEPEVSISECGLPYLISGVVERRDRLVARTPEKFAEQNVEVKTCHRVENIDPESKKLIVKNLTTGETFEDPYDRLIISTGARAIMPPIEGADLDGIFTVRFLTDTDRVMSYIKKRSPRKAVVVGGGYIGLEVAENLVALGMEVSLVEAAGNLAGAYGPEVAEMIEGHMREKGVDCLFTGEAAEAFLGKDGRVRAVTFGDREIEADIVVAGVGARPEVSLARAAGVEIGPTGAIRTNERLETNLSDVWAAGDCIESRNLVTGEPDWFPLGDTANQMGRVAGTNAASPAGEGVLEFPGVLGTMIFKVFDLGVAKTGLSEDEAKEAGFEAVTASVEARSRAGYFPGAAPDFLKLVADAGTGRILGAETVGASAARLVDVCATAIWSRLTYLDLINLDLAYAPPFGPTLSPVIQAATILDGNFERRGVKLPVES